MENNFTWASSIPLMSLLVAVFTAGIVVSRVGFIKEALLDLKKDFNKKIEDVEKSNLEIISEIRRGLVEKITDVERKLEKSSEDQGGRIGELEAEQRAAKAREQTRMEMTGRHAVPQEVR